MKTVLFLLTLASLIQLSAKTPGYPIPSRDVPAQYPGGVDSVHAYLLRHTEDLAFEIPMGQYSTIEIRLTISTEGKVIKTAVSKNFECTGCENELVEAAMAMKGWTPAKKNGNCISSTFWTAFEVSGRMELPPVQNELVEVVDEPLEAFSVDQLEDIRTSDPQANGEEIYDFPSEPAQFLGGQQGLSEYLSKNIVYPKEAVDKKISGKVYLKFIIGIDGSVTHVEVARGIPECSKCSESAVNAVKNMPKWRPAMNNGKVVSSYFNLPIKFAL